jgi:hypothetical protein
VNDKARPEGLPNKLSPGTDTSLFTEGRVGPVSEARQSEEQMEELDSDFFKDMIQAETGVEASFVFDFKQEGEGREAWRAEGLGTDGPGKGCQGKVDIFGQVDTRAQRMGQTRNEDIGRAY